MITTMGNLPNSVPKFQYVFYASAHISVRMLRQCLSISTGIIMAGRPQGRTRTSPHPDYIEGLWMEAKCKLCYQSGTSNGLFRSYLSAFQWRFSHKEHVFGQFINLLSDNYNI